MVRRHRSDPVGARTRFFFMLHNGNFALRPAGHADEQVHNLIRFAVRREIELRSSNERRRSFTDQLMQVTAKRRGL